jgi:hypothetical protein
VIRSFRELLPPLFLLFVLMLISPVAEAQTIVVKLNSQAEATKQVWGIPLFPPGLTRAKAVNELALFRVFSPGEALPPAAIIASLDTVGQLTIPQPPVTLRQRTHGASPQAKGTAVDVIVGVIDTGIDFLHPRLRPHMFINAAEDINRNGMLDSADINGIDDDGNGYVDDVSGYDFVDASEWGGSGDNAEYDPWPDDQYPGGHGTAVADAVLASGFDVKILNLRAGNSFGFLAEDDVARSILYAYQQGARVINMSFGDQRISTFLADVIGIIALDSVLFVASAGNANSSLIHYPSGLSSVLSVGAVDDNRNRAAFSNYGYFVDVYAAGVDLSLAAPGGGLGNFSGTSFSAPFCSGALAALRAKMSGNAALGSLLLQSFDQKGTGWDFDYSNGILVAEELQPEAVGPAVNLISPSQAALYSEKLAVAYRVSGFSDGDYFLATGDGQNWHEHIRSNVQGDFSAELNIEGQAASLLRIQWQAADSRDMIVRHQQLVYNDKAPEIISSDHTQLVEGLRSLQLITARTDRVARLELYSTDFSYLGQNQDTLHTLILAEPPGWQKKSVQLRASNEFGTGAALEVTDLHWPELVYSHHSLSAMQIFNGGGFIWPTRFAGHILLSPRLEAGLDVLQMRNERGDLLFQFANPWIVRAVDSLANGEFRLLLGYANQSAIIDFNTDALAITRRWDFADFWALDILDSLVVMRRDAIHSILQLQDNEWQEVGRLDEHPNESLFGVPGLARGDDFIFIADADGNIYGYKNVDRAGYRLQISRKLHGLDPGNMLHFVSRHPDYPQGALFAVSEVRPETISESTKARHYWSLEGFTITESNLQRVAQINFAGVTPRDEGSPALGSTEIENEEHLVILLPPDAYLLRIRADSLTISGAQPGVNWHNYTLPQRGRSFLANKNGQLVEIFAQTQKTILPAIDNAVSRLYADSTFSLSWQGFADSHFVLRDATGQSDTLINAFITSRVIGFPFIRTFQIKQIAGNNESAWSEEISIDYRGFPDLRRSHYDPLGVIELVFDQAMQVESGSYLVIDDQPASSLVQLNDSVFLARFSAPWPEVISLSSNGVFSREGAEALLQDITLKQSQTEWQPYVERIEKQSGAIQLHFIGSFTEEELAKRENYSLEPSGNVIEVQVLSANSLRLAISALPRRGYAYNLRLDGLRDTDGRPLQTSVFHISPDIDADDGEISIFPQPFILHLHKSLRLAPIAAGARVNIYSSQLEHVIELQGNEVAGSLDWDARNKFGKSVSSGVYIFVVDNQGTKTKHKVLILN